MSVKTSLCGLGQLAPNPVKTTLKYFRDEYIAHVKDKKCPAGVCRSLITIKIDAEKMYRMYCMYESMSCKRYLRRKKTASCN